MGGGTLLRAITTKKPVGHLKSFSLEFLNDFMIKTNRFT